MNREILEHTGWIISPHHQKDFKVMRFSLKVKSGTYHLHWWYLDNQDYMLIDDGEYVEDTKTYFRGTITTKEDLIKLMKQIGI